MDAIPNEIWTYVETGPFLSLFTERIDVVANASSSRSGSYTHKRPSKRCSRTIHATTYWAHHGESII